MKRLLAGVEYPRVLENGDLQLSSDIIVQDYMKYFGDRTLFTGGDISDNGNGTAAIASLTAWCKVTDSDTAIGKFFSFAGGNTASLTDMAANYVYLDYNDGVPQLVIATLVATHGLKQDHILIGTIFRDDTTLHIRKHPNIGIGRANRVDMHHLEEFPAHRVNGLVTSDGGSLALSITTPGLLYEGLGRQVTTVDGTTWSTWYYDFNASKWDEVTGQNAIDNLQYNLLGSGDGLETLTANRYAVHWVYVDIDGTHLHIVYGQGDYKLSEAETALIPALLPNQVTAYGVLIARIYVQKNRTPLVITYPWTTRFENAPAVAAVSDVAYGAGWNGIVDVAPSKNAVYDKLNAGVTPSAHKASHETNGADEINDVDINAGTIGGVTLDGPITLGGQVFDAGSGSLRINTTGAGEGIDVYSTNEGSGVRLSFYHVTASPVADDIPFQWYVYGKDTGGTQRELAIQRFLVESVNGAALAGKMDIYLRTGSAWNQALTLSSAGALWIDAGLTIGGTLTGVTTLTATNISVLNLDFGTESAAGTFSAELTAANAGTAWFIRSRDVGDTQRPRLSLSGGVDTAVWAWTNSTHTGIVLSGALDANSNLINNVTDPSDPQDAATKQYVDDNAGGITQAQVLARVSLRG